MKTKFYTVCFAIVIFSIKNIQAQTNTFPSTGSAGIGTTSPDASSALELKSTTQGLLISRMTQTQRNAIVSPAIGLMIYQTTNTPGFYYYDGSWKPVTPKSKGWQLTGNSGTDTAVNFLGTIDAMPLIIKVNNQRAGYLDFSPTANTSFGFQSLSSITTGTYNSAIGLNTLMKNTSGYYNVANGANALANNTTGLGNIANGAYALYSNISGGSNIASGTLALYSNTTGAANVALGFNAMYNNTTASYNIALGYRSLYSNNKGAYNVATGYQSLYSNTTGYSNVALGVSALYRNTDKSNLIAVGDSALFNNGTGAGASQAIYNTAVGSKALFSNTTGTANTANGYRAMYSNTVGFWNTAQGYRALYLNTQGNANTSNGYEALYSNTTGDYNTANGYGALFSNTSGERNSANGASALAANINGRYNSAIGYEALNSNISGNYNTANGSAALNLNTNGNSNTADGYKALGGNTTGHSNVAVGVAALSGISNRNNIVAVGDSALYRNGFQAADTVHGSFNVAVGSKALFGNTLGYANTATGYRALYSNVAGYNNTAHGAFALSSNSSGASNTAFGNDALSSNTFGTNNTAIGSFAGSLSDNSSSCTFLGYDADQLNNVDLTNSMALGNASRSSSNNQVRIGNSSVLSIGGYVDWSNISDGRYKKNVKENVPGLKFINLLKPVTYTLDINGIAKMLGEDIRDKDKKISIGENSATNKNDEAQKWAREAREQKSNIINTGFIAQDVEEAAKKIGFDFSGVDKPENENTPYALRYAEFVVPLVKAVQELDANQKSQANDQSDAIAALQNENLDLKKQINELKTMMQQLQQSLNNCNPCAQQSVSNRLSVMSDASLQQNIPNPFNHTTTINYSLPRQHSSAKIIVVDKSGKVLKEVNVSGNSKGSIMVDASTLASGAYNYSLFVDGKLIDTKQMEHHK